MLAVQDVPITPMMRHLELFTRGGLLTVLWHGPKDADAALIACGGAMGGLLGPANGLYQFLGDELGELGIATLRVSYRRPNDLERVRRGCRRRVRDGGGRGRAERS